MRAEVRAGSDVAADRRGERDPVVATDHDGVPGDTGVLRRREHGGARADAGGEPAHGRGGQVGGVDRNHDDRARRGARHGVEARAKRRGNTL